MNKSGRKPNKIWLDLVKDCNNRSIKLWLQNNKVEMYSIHNDGKSIVAKRFIRTLTNKIYKHLTAVSRQMYINKLDNVATKYNNKYYKAIKKKPTDFKSSTCIDFDIGSNDKDPKFNIGDYLRISKYQTIFPKSYTPDGLEKAFCY